MASQVCHKEVVTQRLRRVYQSSLSTNSHIGTNLKPRLRCPRWTGLLVVIDSQSSQIAIMSIALIFISHTNCDLSKRHQYFPQPFVTDRARYPHTANVAREITSILNEAIKMATIDLTFGCRCDRNCTVPCQKSAPYTKYITSWLNMINAWSFLPSYHCELLLLTESIKVSCFSNTIAMIQLSQPRSWEDV